ncbi:MAG: hypothetical protein PHD83_04930 [Caldisericia bacterium]|nr:hypothetical protein [Caldisericia bacterium]
MSKKIPLEVLDYQDAFDVLVKLYRSDPDIATKIDAIIHAKFGSIDSLEIASFVKEALASVSDERILSYCNSYPGYKPSYEATYELLDEEMETFREKMNQYVAFNLHSLIRDYFLGVMKGLEDFIDYCRHYGDEHCTLDDAISIAEDFFEKYHSKLASKDKLKAKAFFDTYHLAWGEKL